MDGFTVITAILSSDRNTIARETICKRRRHFSSCSERGGADYRFRWHWWWSPPSSSLAAIHRQPRGLLARLLRVCKSSLCCSFVPYSPCTSQQNDETMSQKTCGGWPYPILWQNLHVHAMYFEECLRHVLRCHLLAKNIANTFGVTHVQEEVMYFGTYASFFPFNSSCHQIIWLNCGFCIVAYVYANRCVLCKAGIFVRYVSLVSLAGWRLGIGCIDGFRFPGGTEICFDKSHVPAVGFNQLHNAVVAPGRGTFFVDIKRSVQEVGC